MEMVEPIGLDYQAHSKGMMGLQVQLVQSELLALLVRQALLVFKVLLDQQVQLV